MSDADYTPNLHHGDLHHADRAPGDVQHEKDGEAEGIGGYLVGLALATLLTVVSFVVAGTSLV